MLIRSKKSILGTPNLYIFSSFIAGILYAFGFPSVLPVTLPLLSILGVASLLWTFELDFDEKEEGERRQSFKRQEIIAVLIFCIVINYVGFYWIAYTLREFGDIAFPLNFIISAFFSLIVMPQYWAFLLVIFVLRRFFYRPLSKLGRGEQNILLAFLLTICEAYTPSLFPAHLGHTFLGFAPYLGAATVGGVPLFSFMGMWMALSLVDVLKRKRYDWFAFVLFALFLLLNACIPLASTSKISKSVGSHSSNMRIVQANIGNVFKISAEKGYEDALKEVISRYKSLSLQRQTLPLDLIIWPETAYPYQLSLDSLPTLLPPKGEEERMLPASILEVLVVMKAELLIGGYLKKEKLSIHDEDYERTYNSVLFFNHQGALTSYYNKQKLIPFGENLPFPDEINRTIGSMIPSMSFFARGKDFSRFEMKNGVSFTTIICYEILFPDYVRDVLNHLHQQSTAGEVDFIINLTNDSWYGGLEPYQHLYLGQWRAIEFDIPIVRSTNTGISTVMYPDGSLGAKLLVGEQNFMDFELKTKKRKATLYQQYGFAIVSIGAFLLFVVAFCLRRKPSLKRS
ncbi:MAG: apolipoprotein N-acyltransferase [Oligoflexia bacterium]|nr:apolipoprotein N-acyltransferase [Oligoflexia bacterium]MBF0365942.1 apolipoprotein N-acyltransferase [Oligoflexia bacterium]